MADIIAHHIIYKLSILFMMWSAGSIMTLLFLRWVALRRDTTLEGSLNGDHHRSRRVRYLRVLPRPQEPTE